MVERLKQVLLEMLTSKKAIATAVGLVLSLAARYGLDLPEQTVTEIVQLIMAYVVGQGIADHGKAAAKIDMQPDVDLAVERALMRAELQRKQVA